MIEWLNRNSGVFDALRVVIAAVIGIVAATTAYIQFTAQWQLENAASAKAAYQDFMKVSLQYPQFSRPDVLGRQLTPMEYEQYFWYMNIMSQTFEAVFEFAPTEENWNWIAREQIRLHCGFFSSPEYRPELYSQRFDEQVQTVLSQIETNQCYIVEFSLPNEFGSERSEQNGSVFLKAK